MTETRVPAVRTSSDHRGFSEFETIFGCQKQLFIPFLGPAPLHYRSEQALKSLISGNQHGQSAGTPVSIARKGRSMGLSDILVLSVGFTGLLVVKTLATHRDRSKFTFALAGRSKSKLNDVVSRAPLIGIKTFQINIADQKNLAQLVSGFRVVINCTSQYWKHGEKVMRSFRPAGDWMLQTIRTRMSQPASQDFSDEKSEMSFIAPMILWQGNCRAIRQEKEMIRRDALGRIKTARLFEKHQIFPKFNSKKTTPGYRII
ncbi:hypothetical protein C8J56DRAFT_895494 [Mycena floridula]|nr:hypothetical protein C8J56DRAFT_895494 [Mycena floridula]